MGENNNQSLMESIEAVVLKYFMRELKLRGLYHHFLLEIPHAGTLYYAMKSFIRDGKIGNLSATKRMSSGDNPFARARSFQEVVKMLMDLNRGIENHHDPHMMTMGMDKNSQRVTMTINHLIHFILERNVRSIDVFNSIGQSVFNNVCNYLYGAEYTDEQNRIEQQNANSMNDPSRLWMMYMEASANGFKGSYDEFVKVMETMRNNPELLGRLVSTRGSIFDNVDEENEEYYDDEEYDEEYEDGDEEYYTEDDAWEAV